MANGRLFNAKLERNAREMHKRTTSTEVAKCLELDWKYDVVGLRHRFRKRHSWRFEFNAKARRMETRIFGSTLNQ